MSTQTRQTEKVVRDIRGQICPSSLLITLREVNSLRERLRSGEASLSIKSDNRDSTTTIPDAVRNMGYAVSVSKHEGYYLITITGE